MKKIPAVVLIFDLIPGLLLFLVLLARLWGVPGERAESGAADTMREAAAEREESGKAVELAADKIGKAEKGKLALTFDDGPHPRYTEQLLDGLRERNVKATFFVTGEHAMLHPDVIARMKNEGHLIGNHTYSHMQLRKNNREEFKQELIRTNEVIESITWEEVQYVRPPYGSWDKSFERELNMIPVLWTVDPADWCSRDADCIARKVAVKAGEDDIILMHDYYETSVTAALQIVDTLLAQGYEFVTVEEILFD